MKGSRFSRFHRTQLLLRLQKKVVAAAAAAASSSVTLGSVRTWASLSCCPGSSFLRQMVCKLKGRWNKAMGWRGRRSPRPQYSYDHHSYCLNFDDGTLSEQNHD
ncbi:hypothetical protein QN277_012838 [Acacia crassicarpa]|uniref:Uncharacterized protein n=1 Tax=Acacia crassicarpa TaxID=499986 RepID=A0AAE1TDT0_9FABA|nr:hypothetical protein QN277_012838 [Acacia crassicarpa]